MKAVRSVEERRRRSVREWETYRRRSLSRRVHARFREDLAVLPHLFLDPFRLHVVELPAAVDGAEALPADVVWALDTAARLATGSGFLAQRDLTGYATSDLLGRLAEQGLVLAATSSLSLDPVTAGPPRLVVHATEAEVPALTLPGGRRVVSWDFWRRDLLGTLGWRPDLLARFEGTYPRA